MQLIAARAYSTLATGLNSSQNASPRASDFDFDLPPELIAQHPAATRSASRLLDGRTAEPVDRVFSSLPRLLQAGDLLVFNDTRVVKARIFGEKSSGGKVELLIERVVQGNEVVAHMKVSKKPQLGGVLYMAGSQSNGKEGKEGRGGGGFTATLIGRWPTDDGALFRFMLSDDPYALMEKYGCMPLPPYIERHQNDSAQDPSEADDAQRYQTVFAKYPGAVAAPTAALHFDEAVLADLEARGVQKASLTLHVGAGTFQPVKTENIADHQMHFERYSIPAATLQAIADCKARGGRVVAVGTTTVRSLENWARQNGAKQMGSDPNYADTGFQDTNIFITPGFQFKVVDLLVTNFHLPKSTLMMLVSAFSGHVHIMALYQHAIAQKYRFFSYGDSMLLSLKPNITVATEQTRHAEI